MPTAQWGDLVMHILVYRFRAQQQLANRSKVKEEEGEADLPAHVPRAHLFDWGIG